jgi:hypothetical protein
MINNDFEKEVKRAVPSLMVRNYLGLILSGITELM